jgi:hypothetical protein
LEEVKNAVRKMDGISINTYKDRCFEGFFGNRSMEIGLRDDLKSEFRPHLPSLGRFGEDEKTGSKHVDAGNRFYILASADSSWRRPHLSETNRAMV